MTNQTAGVSPREGLLSESQRSLVLSRGYEIQRKATRGFSWLYFSVRQECSNGSKLRVNLSARTARLNIERILPILLEARANFKLASDIGGILAINSGQAGTSQAGKALTIYCHTKEETSLIAQRLSGVLVPPFGPCPTSDIELFPGISVRDGSFSTEFHENAASQLVRTDLELKSVFETKPGTYIEVGSKRFVITKTFTQMRNHSCSAFDIEGVRPVFMKRSIRGYGEEQWGSDSCDRLIHEYGVLREIEHLDIAPRPLHLHKEKNSVAAIVGFIDTRNVNELAPDERKNYFKELVTILKKMHDAGWAHRDLKAANALLSNEGKVYLIDFELATRVDEPARFDLESRGYLGKDGLAETGAASDIFALGKILFHLATNIDPGIFPTPEMYNRVLLSYPLHHSVRELIKKCIHPAASIRPSLNEILNVIEQDGFLLNPEEPQHDWKFSNDLNPSTVGADISRLKNIIDLWKEESGERPYWRNTHLFPDIEMTGLNLGVSGLILPLLFISQNPGSDELKELVHAMVESLLAKESEAPSSGLFTGQGAEALVLSLCAMSSLAPIGFDRRSCMNVALERFLRACNRSFDLQDRHGDFFSGAAGLIYLGAFLYDLSFDSQQRVLIREAVLKLVLQTAAGNLLDRCRYPSHQETLFGFAHGLAGEALALKVWVDGSISDKETDLRGHLRIYTEDVFRFLFKEAWNEEKARFPYSNKGMGFAANDMWCHGAMGILQAFLMAFGGQAADFLEKNSLSRRFYLIFQEVVSFKSFDNPSLCHGVSGRLDFLMMVSECFRENGFGVDVLSKMIRSQIQLLEIMKVPVSGEAAEGKMGGVEPQGHIWSSDFTTVTTPDLWVGFLGPTLVLEKWKAGDFSSLLSHSFWCRLFRGRVKQ